MNNTILTPALRAELTRLFNSTTKYAVMALHVFLTKDKPEPEPGFMDAHWIAETLNHWRRAGFYSLADGIAETQLISKFPALAGLLTQIRAGEFDNAERRAAPAIVLPTNAAPIPQPKEITTMNQQCTKRPNCTRTAGHAGWCNNQQAKVAEAKPAAIGQPAEPKPELAKAALTHKPKAEMVYTNPLLRTAPVSLAEAGDVQENVRLEIVRQALTITSRALDLLA